MNTVFACQRTNASQFEKKKNIRGKERYKSMHKIISRSFYCFLYSHVEVDRYTSSYMFYVKTAVCYWLLAAWVSVHCCHCQLVSMKFIMCRIRKLFLEIVIKYAVNVVI